MGKKRQVFHAEFQTVYVDAGLHREEGVAGCGLHAVTSFQEVKYGNGEGGE